MAYVKIGGILAGIIIIGGSVAALAGCYETVNRSAERLDSRYIQAFGFEDLNGDDMPYEVQVLVDPNTGCQYLFIRGQGFVPRFAEDGRRVAGCDDG